MSDYPDFSAFNYKIECELGCNKEGGIITYLAHLSNSSQQVVIKQFRFVQLGSNWQEFKAHEREIAILKKLNHPRIPRYLDSFETNDGWRNQAKLALCRIEQNIPADLSFETPPLRPFDRVEEIKTTCYEN